MPAQRPNRLFRLPFLLLALLLSGLAGLSTAAGAAPPPPPETRVLLCGDQLLPAVPATKLPPGLPSKRCSEVESAGQAMDRAGSFSAPSLDATTISKAPDANSLPLRRSLLEGHSLGTFYVHVLIEDPTAGTLELLRTEIRDSQVIRIASGVEDGAAGETVHVEGTRLVWGAFSPPGPPKYGPTDTYCWDLVSGRSC